MKETVSHEKYGEIVYEETFWLGKKSLFINGLPLKQLDKKNFETEDGKRVLLAGSYLTGVKMQVEGEVIQLVPQIKWYEIVFSVLPFILIMIWGNIVALCEIVPVVGGLIGGAISGMLSVVNLLVIKRFKSVWLKAVISLAIMAATFGICAGIGFAIVASAS